MWLFLEFVFRIPELSWNASFVRKLKNPSKGRESNFDFTLNTELLAGLHLQRPCFQCTRFLYHGCRHVKGDTVGSSSFRLFDYPPSPLSSLFNYLAHRQRYYNIPPLSFVVSRVCIFFLNLSLVKLLTDFTRLYKTK